MASEVQDKKNVRIGADFSPEAYECLEEIASHYGGDKIKALSHALGFISYITRGLEKGQKLIVEKDYKIFGITLYTRRREVLLNEYLFAQQA